MPVAINGYPFTNHATNLRNASGQPGFFSRVAIAQPRPKYTWLAEFVIEPSILSRIGLTTAMDFVRSGRIYGQIQAIDWTNLKFQTDTLRGYNKVRKIQTRMDHSPMTISFHDDSTSMVMALWQEYLAFHHETGDLANTSNAPLVAANNQVSINNKLVLDGARDSMNIRGSLGMRLKPFRTFFRSILIYDYGTEPDSNNVYAFINPVITDVSHDRYDYQDRNGMMQVNMTFEYEAVAMLIGQRRQDRYLQTVLSVNPDRTTSSTGHASALTGGNITARPVRINANFDRLDDANRALALVTPERAPIRRRGGVVGLIDNIFGTGIGNELDRVNLGIDLLVEDLSQFGVLGGLLGSGINLGRDFLRQPIGGLLGSSSSDKEDRAIQEEMQRLDTQIQQRTDLNIRVAQSIDDGTFPQTFGQQYGGDQQAAIQDIRKREEENRRDAQRLIELSNAASRRRQEEQRSPSVVSALENTIRALF